MSLIDAESRTGTCTPVQTGEVVNVEWICTAAVGFCVCGLGLGSKQLLEAIKKHPNPETLRVMEVGPGLGELAPLILELGCDLTLIGEEHLVAQIVDENHCPRIHGVCGWFPEALPDQSMRFDFIFASRVIHCAGLESAQKLTKSMLEFLAPGGKLVVETTGPWSSYYEAWFDQFRVEQEEGYDVVTSTVTEGEGTQTVVLFTEAQACKMFFDCGAREVSITPFLFPAHPKVAATATLSYDQIVAIVASC